MRTDCRFELGISASESSKPASRVRAEVLPWLILRKPNPDPVVQLLSTSESLRSHGLQHAGLPWPSLSPWVCSNSCPLSWWCHPTISSSVTPLLLPSVFPSIRVFFSESALSIRWPKYWCFSFIISPSNEYSGLISFRIECFDLASLLRNLHQALFLGH